jgi:hypothetical protein
MVLNECDWQLFHVDGKFQTWPISKSLSSAEKSAILHDGCGHEMDEYEQYLQEEAIEFDNLKITESAIDYWKSVELRWPYLTCMAQDALSIPALSLECERCFSSSGNMVTGNMVTGNRNR